jgi:hypothetical protein
MPDAAPRLFHLFGCHLAAPLGAEDRALLHDLAFFGGLGRALRPKENRRGYKLEALGLARLEFDRFAFHAWGYYVSHATLPPAGLRAARLGAGCGPVLAAVAGEEVAGWDAETAGGCFTHNSLVDAICAAHDGEGQQQET